MEKKVCLFGYAGRKAVGAETPCNILPLSSSKDEEHALLAL
jgi:hypothetical protein